MTAQTARLASALVALFLLSTAPAALADDALPAVTRLFPFAEGGKWGYLNRQGETAIAPRFAIAYDFSDGRACVHTDKGTGFIDERGQIVFVLPYEWNQLDWTKAFTEGRAAFSVNDKCGFLDRQGKVVVAPKYDNAYPFAEGLAAVNVEAKWRNFPRRLPFEGKWGFIDTTGRLVIPTRFDSVDVRGFSNGLALVTIDQRFAYIDKTGKTVLEFKWRDSNRRVESAAGFSEGLARITTSGPSGEFTATWFIDKAGKFVIKPRPNGAGDFSQGLAAVWVGKRWGYMDHAGCIVIPAKFEDAHAFSDGLAVVRWGGGWCYINQKGQVVIRGLFNDVEAFSGGLARVHEGGKFEIPNDGPAHWRGGAWFYFNAKGEKLRRCRTDEEHGAGYGKETR